MSELKKQRACTAPSMIKVVEALIIPRYFFLSASVEILAELELVNKAIGVGCVDFTEPQESTLTVPIFQERRSPACWLVRRSI